MSRVELDDPRLTAYALGELPEDEVADFEALLAEQPEAKAEVEAIRGFAAELSEELAHDAPSALEPEKRRAIEEGRALAPVVPIVAKPAQRVTRRSMAMWAAPLALAAAAAGVFFVTKSGSKSVGSSRADEAMEKSTFGKSSAVAMATATATPLAYAAASAAPRAIQDQRDNKQKAEDDGYGKPCDPSAPGCGKFPVGQALVENPFIDAKKDNKSTFSVDVDTASYSMVRRSIVDGARPRADFVRVEEMVNYFTYTYPNPDDAAFSVTTDVAGAPWDGGHRLVRIGVHGRDVPAKERPAANLVFLVDVSGSMSSPDKLPLLVDGLKLLTASLDERDHVAIVMYAAGTGVVLPSTSGADKSAITSALSSLRSGGGTNGGAGIELAYAEAKKGFVQGGINRVLLATDGDFNVGITDRSKLVELVQTKAKDGVFLTCLGFGKGNLRDGTLEDLADKGNGNYAYIDTQAEARKVLSEQAGATLQTIAKDVKIQVTFDAGVVGSFKLIGYENRMLAHEDFTNDAKDAGEIGAGHTVTALYDVILAPGVTAKKGLHLADFAIRYKEPEASTSRALDFKIEDGGGDFASASVDFRFAASVASFGLLLRGSKSIGTIGYADVERMATDSVGEDKQGYRKEFVSLVQKAAKLER
ncbi:MAG: von Willebrand factor type A domain-containing protein [Polyangiaceae bacterium]